MTLTTNPDFKEHEEIWLLLPWLANGRLQEPVRVRALQHAQCCTLCSQELQLQEQLCVALAVPERISYVPSTSLNKLLSRIDTVPAERPHPLQPHPLQQWPAGQRASRLWRPAGLAWAASGLMAVGLAMGTTHRELAPVYQVRTDTPAAPAQVLHIVFVRSLTVAQVQSLLQAGGAQLVEGPAGDAGVFGVRPLNPGTDAARQLQQLAAQLRHDPRVRWVESLATPADSVASSTSVNP